jgi:hypothetical protein
MARLARSVAILSSVRASSCFLRALLSSSCVVFVCKQEDGSADKLRVLQLAELVGDTITERACGYRFSCFPSRASVCVCLACFLAACSGLLGLRSFHCCCKSHHCSSPTCSLNMSLCVLPAR